MKILVVDDNRALARTIREILEDEGMEVMSASDGKEGYTAYLLFQPDLVITDIQMPRVNGPEMMAQIRAHNPMVKTVYMSGNLNAFRTLLEGEKERYPVTVFEKPFSMKSLTMLVSQPEPVRPMDSALSYSLPA